MIDLIGWVATGVFAVSYFVRRRRAMLSVQMAAALLWIGYGFFTGAAPVVAANAIVISAAGVAVLRDQ